MALGRTLRQPLAWAGGLATALVGALGPGDIIGYAALHAAGDPMTSGAAGSRAHVFFYAFAHDATPLVGRWLVLATITWVVRAPLIAATFGGDPAKTLSKGFGRFVRTRRVSLMVTAAFALLPMLGLGGWAGKDRENALPWFFLGLLLALAGGWLALSDRYAFRRYDARQDQIAANKRDEARYGGPHYLDTSTSRQGYDVATGADNATTDGGWALLSGRSFAIVLATVVLDLVRFGVSVVVPETGSVEHVIATGIVIPLGSVLYLAVATVIAVISAALWTAAFERTISARE